MKDELTYAEKRILSVIPIGEINGIRQTEIANLCGYSTREVRFIINSLRLKDLPICSGNTGYYKAETEEEIDATIYRLQSQISTLQQSVNHLRRCKRKL